MSDNVQRYELFEDRRTIVAAAILVSLALMLVSVGGAAAIGADASADLTRKAGGNYGMQSTNGVLYGGVVGGLCAFNPATWALTPACVTGGGWLASY